MADAWGEDSDDEWDIDDDDLDARLGLAGKEEEKTSTSKKAAAAFDDEEDLAVTEQLKASKLQHAELKKKGQSLAAKKAAEAAKEEELELAKLAMQVEADQEARMTTDELREYKRKQIEQADNALTDDLFGDIDDKPRGPAVATTAAGSGDVLVLNDVVSHMKHARKIGSAVKAHGKIHWTKAFIEETIKQCKDVLDADAVGDIIKTCNVVKNEKVQASKRKVKGEAQKK